ncbi:MULTISPECIES: thioredoxin domain-containing protein [Nocardiaceae]|uniref:Protein-disulfide isomerase n=1 Tax=Rhodococcoides corynebacterioides TaxID=53972 RepID=A0ABS2KT15_9NOCA|nr:MULTISPECIES: thioredoxin domain-containing protein [Rhodococcus]MBM7415088.1 protein-disulfide isomerase [Rhodococcus corynebacterioides]MBP1117550.1 protein-disulfide isomerase [Rhodococcus sp. PvP016]
MNASKSSSSKSSSKYTPQKSSSTSTYVLGGLALLVIAAVVIGGVLWQNSRSQPRADGYGSVQNAAVTSSVDDDGVVRLGLPEATRTVDIYEDAMCPYCAELENTYGQELAQKIDDGTIAVRYHMLDFLNQLSPSGDYSTRAAAASQCVAATGDGPAYSAFHSALFSPDFQPEEKGSADHTADELAARATEAGAPAEAAQCITDGTRVADAATDAATGSAALAAAGARGTPTVIVDGAIVDTTTNSAWVSDLG